MSITADSLLELARQGRETFESLAQAGANLTYGRLRVETVKQELRRVEDEILLQHIADPKVLGPNEATRDATLRHLTTEKRQWVARYEKEFAELQIAYDNEKLYLDGLKFQSALWRTVAALQISKAGEEEEETR